MKQRYRRLDRMHGLSLIELMVAMTLGLIILAAVSSLFVTSRQTYTTQDSLARLQENGRFAMQFLIKDLRLAGYFGCLDDVDAATTNTSLNGGATFFNNAFMPIEAVENNSGTWLPSGTARPASLQASTDAVALRMADSAAAAIVAPGMLNGASPLLVNDPAPFVAGDTVVVADCAVADIMAISAVTGSTLSHAPGTLGKAYVPPATVSRLITRQYSIRTKTNPDGQVVPGLYRQDNAGAALELVEGVENLQILYGVDTNAPPDGVPNVYRKADIVGDWTKVISVRLGILVRTVDDNNAESDSGTYDVDGDGTNELSAPGDRFRRRIFQATVHLRNVP